MTDEAAPSPCTSDPPLAALGRRPAADHGDQMGLEMGFCGPVGWTTARLDPRSSFVMIGPSGAGKTCFSRAAAAELLSAGGRVVVLDRFGEHARAPVPVARAQVVDLKRCLLDPLQIFEGEDRTRHTVAVVQILCGGRPESWKWEMVGMAVGHAVDDGACSLRDVCGALEANDAPSVRRAGAMMRIGGLGGHHFDSAAWPRGEKPVLDGDYVSLLLPPELHWSHPRRVGRSYCHEEVYLYLAVALGQAAVSDPHRYGALVLDGIMCASSELPLCNLVVTGMLPSDRTATWVLVDGIQDLPKRLGGAYYSNFLMIGRLDEAALMWWMLRGDQVVPGLPVLDLYGLQHAGLWADRQHRLALAQLPAPEPQRPEPAHSCADREPVADPAQRTAIRLDLVDVFGATPEAPRGRRRRRRWGRV